MRVHNHAQSFRYVVGVITGFIGLGALSPALAQGPSFQGLGDLPGGSFDSQANGVSADGSVVVGFGISASGFEAFRWTEGGGMVGLGDLPRGTSTSQAFGVSADGSVVVGSGWSASGGEAFRWTQGGGMVGLGDLPGGSFFSIANGVSADGSVVVGRGNSASGQEAFIWHQTDGMRNLREVLVNDLGLDLTGWTLIEAIGISDNGLVIVGVGSNPSGDVEAWMAIFPCTDDAQCDDGDECTLNLCVDDLCETTPRIAADVDKDGDVDLFDLFCVLNAFSGNDNCSTCP